MKKILICVIGLLGVLIPIQAQNVYVCSGYGYDIYSLDDVGDMTFSSSSGSMTIGSETYDVDDIDSITFIEPKFPTVEVVYSGTTASVTIPSSITGVTCSSGTDSHVVLTSNTSDTEYLYTVSGSSTNGSLTINGDYKLSLKLAGLTLKSGSGAAIDIECGKRIDVYLKEGTENTLTDYANGVQKGALYTKGHAEFKGSGTLNVTGNTKHAICAKEYIVLKSSLGTINILGAVSDGIHCGKAEAGNANNYFQMNGGTVNIAKCAGDCIDPDDYGCMIIKGGTLNLAIAQLEGTGMKCDSIFTMTGGNIGFIASGIASEAIRCTYHAYFNGGTISGNVTANGSRGIRGKNTTKYTDTTLKGGYLDFNGTNVNLNVSGGTYTAEGLKCFGIKADLTLKQTAGDLTVTVTNTAATDVKATTDSWIGGTRNGVSQ